MGKYSENDSWRKKYEVLSEKFSIFNQLEKGNEFSKNKLNSCSIKTEKTVKATKISSQNANVRHRKLIQTCIRIKPRGNSENFEWEQDEQRNVLQLKPEGEISTKSFRFDHIFGPEKKNDDIFDEIKHSLESTLDGIDACVVTYGSSGSGKTHTMVGCAKERGIIQRAIEFVMTKGKHLIEDFSMQFLICEIYNGTIIDLLHENTPIRKNVRNCVEIKSEKAMEFQRYFKLANKRRQTTSTTRNNNSSRSHMVIRLTLQGLYKKTQKKFKSSLMMLDCAGPETIDNHKDEQAGTRKLEMSFINKSFSSLSTVIQNLKNRANYTDFRSSKLTQILRPYFCTSMILIGTISQDIKHLKASKTTCKIVSVANQIERN